MIRKALFFLVMAALSVTLVGCDSGGGTEDAPKEGARRTPPAEKRQVPGPQSGGATPAQEGQAPAGGGEGDE